MNRSLAALSLIAMFAFGASGCASNASVTSPPTAATRGEIVLSESIPNVAASGGNAALAIGSAVAGALIPGGWGNVASVATGQVGQAALAGSASNMMRYHVRMADGSVKTIDQAGGTSLPAGTPVDILTMSDGSARVVANTRSAT